MLSLDGNEFKNSLSRVVCIGIIGSAWFYSAMSYSQDIVLSSGFRFNMLFNDQYDIDTADSEAGAFEYAPFLSLGYETQTYTSTVEADAAYTYFVNSTFQNTTNAGVDWRQSKAWQRSNLEFNLGVNERRISDLDEFDDSQDISVDQAVRQLSGDLVYTSQVSERTGANIVYGINRQTSDINENIILTHTISVGFARVNSPRSTLAVDFAVELFEPDLEEEAFDIRAQTYGLNIGGVYQLGENWLVDGAVGVSVLKYDLDNGPIQDASIEDGDPNFVADVSATYQGRVNTVNLSFQSGVNQQLDGLVESQQSVAINWAREYTRNLSGGVLVSAQRRDRNDRQDISFDGYLELRASERLNYRFAYTYDKRDINLGAVDARESNSSNQVSLTVQYNLQDRRF